MNNDLATTVSMAVLRGCAIVIGNKRLLQSFALMAGPVLFSTIRKTVSTPERWAGAHLRGQAPCSNKYHGIWNYQCSGNPRGMNAPLRNWLFFPAWGLFAYNQIPKKRRSV